MGLGRMQSPRIGSADANSEGSRTRTAPGSGTSGPRGWWSSSRRHESRSRDSLASSGSGPKSPMVQSTQEMARIEGIFSSPSSNPPVSPASPLSPRSGPPAYPQPGLLQRPGIALRPGAASQEVVHQVQERNGSTSTANDDPEGLRDDGQWEKTGLKSLQSRMIMVLVAALLEVIVLSIYLGLVLNHKLDVGQEWNIIFIMVILAVTIFVCYTLIRLCIEKMKARRPRTWTSAPPFARIPPVADENGYAHLSNPIQINAEQPMEEEGIKEPPPVYGLWRCSVRVNPDQFYWVRRASNPGPGSIPEEPAEGHPPGTIRPPSYQSDDGVMYAVEAAPRSTAPEPPLPPHPSELRRLV